METPDINVELPEGKNLVGIVAAPLALFGVYKLGRAAFSKLRARRSEPLIVVPPVEE